MKEKTSMRRVWWFRDWQYEQAEAWLADLSEQGWRLKFVGSKVSIFRKCAPERLKYRCVFHPFIANENEKDYIAECKLAGWNYVDRKGSLLIFSAPEGTSEDVLRIDPSQHASILRKSIRNRIIGCLAFLLLFSLFHYLLFSNSRVFVKSLLEKDIIYLYTPILFLVYITYRTMTFVRMFSEWKRLKRRIASHDGMYKKSLIYERSFGVVFIVILLLSVFPFWRDFEIYDECDAFQPVKGISVLTFEDIATNPGYTLIGEDNDKYICRVYHGMLFPDQVDQIQLVHVIGKDNEKDSILVEFGGYRAATPWLAALLAEQLAREYDYHRLIEPEDAQGFDRLWLSDNILIAVRGDSVYFVDTWFSSITSKDIVPMLHAKIEEQTN